MFFELLNMILNNSFFCGSYSNEIFPEPLSSEEEIKDYLQASNSTAFVMIDVCYEKV